MLLACVTIITTGNKNRHHTSIKKNITRNSPNCKLFHVKRFFEFPLHLIFVIRLRIYLVYVIEMAVPNEMKRKQQKKKKRNELNSRLARFVGHCIGQKCQKCNLTAFDGKTNKLNWLKLQLKWSTQQVVTGQMNGQ